MVGPESFEPEYSQHIDRESFYQLLINIQINLTKLYDDDKYDSEQVNNLVDRLNSVCPYLGALVLMNGSALVPEIDEDLGIVVNQGWHRECVDHGVHEGLIVIEEEVGPVLAHKIHTGQMRDESQSTFQHVVDTFSCFMVDASVIPISDIDSAFGAYYLSEHLGEYDPKFGFELLQSMSTEFARMINSTKFRRLSKAKQSNLIEQMITDSITYSSLVEQEMLVSAQYGYLACIDAIDYRSDMVPISIDAHIILGDCLTIDMLQSSNLDKTRITSDQYLVDKRAGLCLVLELDEKSKKDLSLEGNSVLYVPLSSQSVQVELP